MTKIVAIKGNRFFISGKIGNLTHSQIQDSLWLAGGNVAYGLDSKVDYVVLGRSPASAVMDWVEKHKPETIEQEDFLELLGRGEVIVGALEDADFEQAVGELRGVLDGEVTPSTWMKITALLDACEPEAQDAVADYVNGHLATWQVDQGRRWWASLTEFDVPGGSSWIAGDLRRAPKKWVEEILAGEHYPKHRTARVLSLDGLKINTTQATKIFASPYLHQVHALDPGRAIKMSKSFYTKMTKTEAFKGLETLFYYPRKGGLGAALAGATHLNDLRHLQVRATVYSGYQDIMEDTKQLFQAPWLDQLETIESSCSKSTGWTGSGDIIKLVAEHADRLTSLKRLVLSDTGSTDLLVSTPVASQLEELHLAYGQPHSLRLLCERFDGSDRAGSSLRLLDLSQLAVNPRFLKEMRQELQKQLKSSRLFRGLETLVLPKNVTKPIRDRAEALPDVTVEYRQMK